MKTSARKMSIFVVMLIATTTALTLGTSSALAAKTHTHAIQLKNSGDDWFPTPTAMTVSNTHTHHHNMHLMSSNGNDLAGTNGINSIGSRNNGFPTGWVGGFSPTQYGSTVSPSYHNHIPTGTIAGLNRGFGNDDIPTGWAFNN